MAIKDNGGPSIASGDSLRIGRLPAVIARLLVGAVTRRASRGRTPSAAEIRNAQWLEGALRGGSASHLWVTLRGTSMAPAMLPGDRLVVTPLLPGEDMREGDVFVARKGGWLVAHRLLRRLDGAVILRGDAAAADDPPIPLGDVLARAVATHHASEGRS